MKTYTVTQLALLSGVSVRTLHHYDEIGLLKPAFVGENRYRYYGREELLRLQEILFHRELGVPLREIRQSLEDGGRNRLKMLIEQKARLVDRAQQSRQLIRTIDRTIAELNGGEKVSDNDLYKGFSEKKQAEYERWLVEEYGPEMGERIEQGRAKLQSMDDVAQRGHLADLAEIESSLAAAMRDGIQPDDQSIEALIARHRAWISKMGNKPCSPAQYVGLSELYLSHPDFGARYESIEPGFTDWLVKAMRGHAERQSA